MVDLFATDKNNQVLVFFSKFQIPESSRVNARTTNWDRMWAYANPPYVLNSRVLRKIRRHPSCQVLLIALFWPSQTWFLTMSKLLIDTPIQLPMKSNLLRNSVTWELFLAPKSLRLTAWPVTQSTRELYDGRLGLYREWCASKGLNQVSTTPPDVAEFLSTCEEY